MLNSIIQILLTLIAIIFLLGIAVIIIGLYVGYKSIDGDDKEDI